VSLPLIAPDAAYMALVRARLQRLRALPTGELAAICAANIKQAALDLQAARARLLAAELPPAVSTWPMSCTEAT
jgi:hypothetical protein